jgi:hypothetical protein
MKRFIPLRAAFTILMSILIVGWLNFSVRSDPPEKPPFDVGDKVEMEWGDKTVQGQIMAVQPGGMLKVICNIRGRDITLMVPPENLRKLDKDAPVATKDKKGEPGKKETANPGATKKDSAASNPVAGSKSRSWTDITGKHRIEAAFVEIKDGKAVLKKADGSTVGIPLDKLSAADRKAAEKLAEELAADNPFTPADDNPFTPAEPAAENPFTPADDDAGTKEQAPATPANWSHVKQITINRSASGKITPDAIEGEALGKPRSIAFNVGGAIASATSGNLMHSLVFDRARGQLIVGTGSYSENSAIQLNFCDLKAGKWLRAVEFQTAALPADVSPDGSLVACSLGMTSGFDPFKTSRTVEVWKLGQKPALVAGWKAERIPGADFLPGQIVRFISSEQVLTFSPLSGTVTLWKIKGAEAVYSLQAEPRCFPVLSANRKQLAVMTLLGPAVLEAATGRTLAVLASEPDFNAGFAFRADGRQLACLSINRLRIWDLEKKSVVQDISLSRELPADTLAWIDDDHLLAGGAHLIEISKRIELWQYQFDGNGAATIIDGQLCYALPTSDAGRQMGTFFVPLPHSQAVATAKDLTADQLTVLKPGMDVSLDVRLNGAPDEVKTVTDALTAQLKANQMKVVATGAAVTIELAVDQGQTTTETYESDVAKPRTPGGNIWDINKQQETVNLTNQTARVTIKQNGKTIWERSGQFNTFAPPVVWHAEGETVQQALDKKQPSPLQFFQGVLLPKNVARPGEKGAYGASRLTAQGIAPVNGN